MQRARAWVAVPVLLAVIASACGGGSADPDRSTGAAPVTETTVRLTDLAGEADATTSADVPQRDEADPAADSVEEGAGSEATAADGTGPDRDPAPSTLLPPDTPVSLVSYLVGGSESQKASRLEIDARAGECMRARGFDYVPLVNDLTVYLGDVQTIGERMEYAQRYGYGAYYYETEAGRAETRRLMEAFEGLGAPRRDTSAAYRQALLGDTDLSIDAVDPAPGFPLDLLGDGCLKEAIVSFRADQGLPPLTQDVIGALFSFDPSTSAAFQSAEDAWIACMAGAGITATSATSVRDSFLRDYDAGVDRFPPEAAERRFAEEVRAATADASCTWQHLLPVTLRLERERIDTLAETYPELAGSLPVVAGLEPE